MSRAVIDIQDVSFSYGGPLVLQDVTLEVAQGEFLGLVGPNAGGKSTLLKLILGEVVPLAGSVRVFGRRPRDARPYVGYVPQYPEFSRDFPITVEQVVLTGRLGMGRIFGGYGRTDREQARRVMKETEIGDLAQRPIGFLSGGQLQRVLLARALACEPRLLLLDEPTANIDMRVENEIFDLLKLLSERMAVVVVSHDIAFISGYVHRVACLNRTLMCHETAAIDGHLINDLYGADMRMVTHRH